jgi:hypothetical protein
MIGVSILFPLVSLLGFVALAVAAVLYFRSEKEPDALQRRFLPRFYVYAMLFVALLIFLVGGGQLLKAVLAYPLGIPFSYRGEPQYEQISPGAVPPRESPKLLGIKYRDEERTRDLLGGASLAVVGALFFIVHRALRGRLESRDEQRQSFLNKAYLAINGVVYGGIALVLTPLSLYQLIDYLIIAYPQTEGTFWQRPVPGESIGFAVIGLAMWLALLPQLFRTLTNGEAK